jgi:hypothetical protein
VLNIRNENFELGVLQTKSAQLKKSQLKLKVIETNRPDLSLLMPLARHLYGTLLVEQTED